MTPEITNPIFQMPYMFHVVLNNKEEVDITIDNTYNATVMFYNEKEI